MYINTEQNENTEQKSVSTHIPIYVFYHSLFPILIHGPFPVYVSCMSLAFFHSEKEHLNCRGPNNNTSLQI